MTTGNEIDTFEHDGIAVQMDSARSDVYRRHYAAGRFYEHDFLHYLADRKIAGCYADVGVNIGNHAVFFGLFCAAEHVVGFEPIDHYFNIASENVARNDLDAKVHIHNVGASDATGRITISFDRVEQEASIAPLDDFEFPAPVTLMKIDVEGMEPPVLRGARELLARDKPVLYVEAIQPVGERIDTSAIDEVIRPLGYRPTGRIFNYQPTVEYVHDESPARVHLPSSRQELDVTTFVTNDGSATAAVDGELAVTVETGKRTWLGASVADFEKPAPSGDFSVNGGEIAYLEVETEIAEGTNAAFHLIQYDASGVVHRDKFHVNRRTSRRFYVHADAQSVRVLISIEGAGSLTLGKLALSASGPARPPAQDLRSRAIRALPPTLRSRLRSLVRRFRR